MTVGRICVQEVDLAEASESVQAAAQRMDSRNVGTLVVVDRARRPIGILTDRDVALRVVGKGRSCDALVGDVMTPNPDSLPEEAGIEKALGRMRALGVRRLPVIDADGRLSGLVSADDILALLAEEFGELRKLIARSSPERLAEV